MRNTLIVAAALTLGLALSACQSKHESGVKSSYRSQWTSVAADTAATTSAARTVLEEEGLRDVKADSTNLDGTARGKKADGTEIKVAVKKQTDTTSQVSVTVGTIGDPAVGAEIAKKIKMRAEGQ